MVELRERERDVRNDAALKDWNAALLALVVAHAPVAELG